jgi:hypothetical protein
MEASEMLDVIHYLFEEDTSRYSSGEQAEAVSAMRTQLYLSYNKTYQYGGSGKNSSGGRSYMPKGSSVDYDFDDDPLMGGGGDTKAYIAPTTFNPDSTMPFGSDLGAPLA